MTLPLRRAVYGFFDRWVGGRNDASTEEIPVKPRPVKELLVCADGQVNVTFHSRLLLPRALEEFQRQKKPPRAPLRDLLGLDHEQGSANITEVAAGPSNPPFTLLLINGNESPDWREEKEFLRAMAREQRVMIVDPRGAGKLRLNLSVRGRDYADALDGVEENVAYNAFLVGKSIVGMRVADMLAAVEARKKIAPAEKIVLCGRADAALVACFAAAVQPAIAAVATESMRLSFLPMFSADARPCNAASILPGLLQRFGDIADVLAQIAPRKILVAAGEDQLARSVPSVTALKGRFTAEPLRLTNWLRA
jgi:hypothetical protein